MNPYFRPHIASSIKRGTPRKRFELTEKQLETLKTVSHIVLALGMVAGIVALTAVAPNIFQYLDKMPWVNKTFRRRDTKWKDQQQKIIKSLYYLKREGYVDLIPEGNDFKLKIRKKGRKKILRMQFNSLTVSMKGRWDGHWWVVLADIPSKDLRRNADYFREKLKAMDFYPLQRTVWLFPFDPRDEVDFVAAYYKVERFVTTMEIIRLDGEDEKASKSFFKEKKII